MVGLSIRNNGWMVFKPPKIKHHLRYKCAVLIPSYPGIHVAHGYRLDMPDCVRS